jgi:hypothetical protein
MEVQEMVSEFLASTHGQNALADLTAQGFSAEDATSMLSAAAAEGKAHAEEHAQSSGILGEHPGRNFFAAFAAGLVRGDGFLGSLVDGGEGVLVGRITEAIANQFGLDGGVASTVAAIATPYIVGYLKEKFS